MAGWKCCTKKLCDLLQATNNRCDGFHPNPIVTVVAEAPATRAGNVWGAWETSWGPPSSPLVLISIGFPIRNDFPSLTSWLSNLMVSHTTITMNGIFSCLGSRVNWKGRAMNCALCATTSNILCGSTAPQPSAPRVRGGPCSGGQITLSRLETRYAHRARTLIRTYQWESLWKAIKLAMTHEDFLVPAMRDSAVSNM